MAEQVEELDDVVHQRTRLGILTICHESKRVEFRFLQETLAMTAGNLSRHLRVLEEAQFIEIEKLFEGRRPKTWIAITKEGVASLEREIEALRVIVARVDASGARSSAPGLFEQRSARSREPETVRINPIGA